MANPEIRIHNLETGQIVDREMTDEEYEVFQTEQAEWLTTRAAASE